MDGIVSRESWIGNLPERVRTQVYDACETVWLPAGATLVEAGTIATGMYQLDAGYIRLDEPRPGSAPVLIAIYIPGNCFLEAPLLVRRPARHTTVAMSDATLRHLPATHFWALYRAHHEIPEALCVKLANQSSRQLNVTRFRASNRLGKCLALTIEQLMDACGTRHLDGAVALDLPLTQSDLAGHFGVTRQSVQREITALRQAGIIAKRGDTWFVMDAARLRAIA